MSESILLTDSDTPEVLGAVALLDGWRLECVPARDLADAVGHRSGVRGVLVVSQEPSVLRAVVEAAHARGQPCVVATADEAARRPSGRVACR